MSSTLCRDSGARLVTLDDLETMQPPPATDTWFPVAHSQVVQMSTGALENAGFEIAKTELAVSSDNARFFGTIDLKSEVVDGVHLAVGIRNSTDKSFPIGFCCGERCFVCDNLSFAADIVISSKHTRHGADRYVEEIANAVFALHGYQVGARKRIERFRETALTEDRANSLILQSYRRGIVGARVLPKVCEAWEKPPHEEFQERTLWSLQNAFSEAFKDRQRLRPAEAAAETIRLERFLEQQCVGRQHQSA